MRRSTFDNFQEMGDDKRIVADKEVVKVPMMMMDAVQRAVALDGIAKRQPSVRHAPGYVFDGRSDNAREAAWLKQGRFLKDAWRTPELGDRRPKLGNYALDIPHLIA